MGANISDFMGSGNSARSTQLDGAGSGTDMTGAMQSVQKFDGPGALSTNNTQNKFTGKTAGAVAYRGT
jgi:hypothetical protein